MSLINNTISKLPLTLSLSSPTAGGCRFKQIDRDKSGTIGMSELVYCCGIFLEEHPYPYLALSSLSYPDPPGPALCDLYVPGGTPWLDSCGQD